MGFYQFTRKQFFNRSKEELWKFISDPINLKKITPEYMGFDIVSDAPPFSFYEGMIIEYKVSPLMGIKTTWVTEITEIKENEFFIDEQRIGPYKLWHHQHILVEKDNGTEMIDIVSYQPPFGFLGNIANSIVIRKKLQEIFEYRHQVLEDIFG